MSNFENADEALSYVLQHAYGNDYDQSIVDEAAALIEAALSVQGVQEMRESIQQLIKLIVNGSEYFHHIYQQLTIKLQLETDPTKQAQIAVGVSETAGAAKALSWVVEHVMSDEAGQPASLEQIFTGEGLSYPAALKRGGSKLFIPKH
ncbi:hypothetical protein SEA_LINETTI_1 [Gordonia phage Linetti]|nr:hypothetical protein SEA_LINETTI_1 [Gordonia phage Linetti]